VKSIVDLEINVPQQELFKLFADPRNNPKWMHDLDRYEPVSGEEGMPGSIYRLVPKKGNMVFLATVLDRNPPNELRLNLEASVANVAIAASLIALSPTKTRLISEEVFTLKGFLNRLLGPLFARNAMKTAHRNHMVDLKSFAEESIVKSFRG